MSIIEKILNEDYSTKKDKNEEENWFDQFLIDIDPSTNKSEKHTVPFLDYAEDKDESDTLFDSILSKVIESDSDSEDSTENKINKLRSKTLNEKLSAEFITLLREEDFEFGYTSRSEKIIQEQLQINALATRNWLNEIFIDYFYDEIIVIGILRIIGRFDPFDIFPQGQTIALAALNHKNDEIKELGIRAFEKWCSVESLNILNKLQIETPWLQEYVNDVIKDFEEQLCHTL